MEKTIQIMLTDDKARYRKAIKDILEGSNISVMAEAENGKECLQMLKSKKPDVLLLDLEMPVMDGNETFNQLCKNFPGLKVIILSLHFEYLLVENYIERGAKGYLTKDSIMDSPVLLINGIQKVFDGGTFVYEKPRKEQIFSERQKEILPLIFEGKTNEEIGKDIGLNKRSVEKQRQKIYEKSGVQKAIDFYKYAFSKGLQFLGRSK